jgi:mycothiol S-conjugate amidase
MYYTLWAKERIMAVHEALLLKYGESPFDENWRNRASQDHRITTRLDIGRYLPARTLALRAHATQVDPTSKWWFGLDDEELAKVYPWEDWILAATHVGEVPVGMQEADLFVGLRQHEKASK